MEPARVDQILAVIAEFRGAVFERFDGIDARFDGVDGRLDGIDGRLDGIDGRLDRLEDRVTRMDDRLTLRIDGVERELREFRAESGVRFDRLDVRMTAVEAR
jgi:archaellum component FlaC